MKKKLLLFQVPVFIVLSSLLVYFFQFCEQARHMVFDNHAFAWKPGPFLLQTVLVFVIMTGLWLLFSKWLSRLFNTNFNDVLMRNILSWVPVLFFLFMPLANRHYLSSDDLITRFSLLGIAVLIAVLYLKAAGIWTLHLKKPSVFGSWANTFSKMPLKKKLVLLFLTSILVYNAGSLMIISQDITFSGDEPHYLMISHSLLYDGDINLANNYENRDYKKYMPPETQLVRHIAPGTQGKYSFHSPGFSILMLPFYALASLFKGKLLLIILRFSISLIGAFLGIQIFLYARHAWNKENLAVILWALFCFTSPIFFYSFHLYPELLITLLSFYVFRILNHRASFSRSHMLGIGLILSTFIWFHSIKYVIIAGTLILYGLWVFLKKHKVKWNVLAFLVFPLILVLLHLYFQYTLYGSLSPSAISTKGQLSSQGFLAFIRTVFVDIPFRYRWETLAGYFLDQKDGFLLYSPIYFFAFLGMIEMFKRKRQELYAILFILAPYILFSAFMTQRTGYAPQARPVVAVTWGFGIMLGYFLAYNAKKIFSVLFSAAVFVSFVFTYLLLKNPLALYQVTTYGETQRAGTFFLHLSNLHFYLPKFLPSFTKMDDAYWPPNIIWIAAIPLFILLYLVVKKHNFTFRYSCHVAIALAGITLFSSWIVLFPKPVLLYPINTAFPTGEKIVFYSLGRVAKMQEPGKFILPQANRDYVFYFTSWRKISKFHLELGSDLGTYDVRVQYFDKELFKGTTEGEILSLEFIPSSSYPLNKHHLYRISLSLKNLSGISTHQHPYRFTIIPR